MTVQYRYLFNYVCKLPRMTSTQQSIDWAQVCLLGVLLTDTGS